MKNYSDVIEKVKQIGPQRVAVAVAEDAHVIESVWMAKEQGLVEATLFGDEEKIKRILAEYEVLEDSFEIVHVSTKEEACQKAVQLVRNGGAATVMKGLVDTAVIMKAVLDKEHGLRAGKVISHANLMKIEGFDRFLVITDAAINVFPTLEQKADIIENALLVTKAIGITNPKVALLCPVEKVNEKIESTVHAAELKQMYLDGKFKDCVVEGPLQLDNAVSEAAAKTKGIESEVAGKADVLIAPNLEVGNVLTKSLEYFSKNEKGGVVLGAKMPIILTSRASSAETKLNSIALALLVADTIRRIEA